MNAAWGNHVRYQTRSISAAPQRAVLKLAREDVAELDLQLPQDRFQLVQGQVVLSPLDAMQGGMGNAHPLSELGVRQASPRFSQVFRQLSIQIPSHAGKLPKPL